MSLKTVTNEKVGVTLNDYVENIESDVSEIKFFLSQIYKAFTIYKDKKEEFKEEVQKLNEIISDLKERETKYKQEIENLNKSLQSIRDNDKKYNDQIMLLERRLAQNNAPLAPPARNRKNPQQPQSTVSKVNSPDIFYEKRPYYNDLNVSKVIDPFRNFRAVN